MKFENVRTYGWESAFHGMRNPKNSWALSDSKFGICQLTATDIDDFGISWDCYIDDENYSGNVCFIHYGIVNTTGKFAEYALIGPKDMELAQTLIRSGPEHRKFMRQLFVSVDITAPLYWWKELDTYKIGTVANSTSTMHKITSKPITIDCFEMDDYHPEMRLIDDVNIGLRVDCFIDDLEQLRQMYLETKDKKYWKELIRWLPESWLQTRTVTMNYENLLSMCSKGQRRFHKLTEWSESFIEFARSLPYAQKLIFIDELDNQSY